MHNYELKAPYVLDYSDNNFENTNCFIDKIKELSNEYDQIILDFVEIQLISSTAMVSLLAEIDIILSVRDDFSISIKHPKSQKIKKILKQIGFYQLIGRHPRIYENFDCVDFCQFASGVATEQRKLVPLLENIALHIGDPSSKKLYRGLIEALANSVEHAYEKDISHCKWWLIAGNYNEDLILTLCDKGQGFKSSLSKKNQHGFIQSIFEKWLKSSLDSKEMSDSQYIKAATILKKTSTLKQHRGKGLSDIISVINELNEGALTILSNSGKLFHSAQSEVLKDYKSSINGTIIEWRIAKNRFNI